jgi:addiction module HigA family antidote
MKPKNLIPLGPTANTPGDILSNEFLLPLGLTVSDLAQRMGCEPMTVSEIVQGKRVVTARTSILLGKILGVSPQFFLGLQTDHDLAVRQSQLAGLKRH